MRGVEVSSGILFCSIIFYAMTVSAVTVSSVNQLENAVSAANSGGDKNIIISASSVPYNLDGIYLRLTADNITVRGATGKSDDVVLDGRYITTEIFQVIGSHITIKDLTLKRAVYHPIHVYPESKNVAGTLVENVRIIDPGQQAIKINQDGAKMFSATTGTIKNSRIELSAAGRAKVWEINGSCYTGGVDGHHAIGWNIADNTIEGFWCEDGLSEHGVHLWSFSQNTVVERNLIINCDRGIGFGLGDSGHIGGIIRNNMIFHDAGHAYSDVGISLETASGAEVYNNTIYFQHSYPNAIEYRFAATTGGSIQNNLTNKAISSRNGGTATVSHNIVSAQNSYFKDVTVGDLHLSYAVPGVIDSGIYIADLQVDIDKELRAGSGSIDIGADELASGNETHNTIISPVVSLLLQN